jgi:iron complex outermembrane recepter protein
MLQKTTYICAMNRQYWIIVLAGLFNPLLANGQISGLVYNQDKTPLPGAVIWLLPDSSAQVSDESGRFAFTGLDDGLYTLETSYIGFAPQRIPVEVRKGKSASQTIILLEEGTLLDVVVVTEEHAKQELTLHAEHFTEQLIERNLHGTFAKSIEKLPGISAINVGVGIAKPVIRGLSFNRIIVNQQGIKQESQQWGADHGLELDQFDVERVEIIKGPGSLQYGSDGLGGVINIMPGRIMPKNTFGGSVLGVYKSNNEHWGGSAKVGANINDFFFSVRYSQQEFGDYQVPADQFIYNSFVLPIYDNRLKNTAGQERNTSFTAGLKRDWGISRLIFSHYSLKAGLFAGAVGIPRSYALEDDGNRRDIDVPSQEVDHYKFSFHQTVFRGKDHFDFNLGYQFNLRREFSFPEFHSIPSSQIDPGNTLALELGLHTLSANFHYEHHPIAGWKMIYGGNAQWQENRRGGFEFLLPSFHTLRSGIFALAEKELAPGWLVNGGLRLDYANNHTDFTRQWVWDSNENIIDSLIAPATDVDYFNWSASVGANIALREDSWFLKLNFGKSFRVPYPAETVSNGIHHGTFRHEVGTPNLQSEHGYQLDMSMELALERFSGSFSAYFNYFDNYIYLGPTFPARFSPLPEAGQIFQYRQDDAIYTGFELEWKWDILPFLSLQQATDFVQSYNLNTQLALPFTPQPAIRTSLQYSISRGQWLKELYFEAGHQYLFAAEGPLRADRSERPTPAYQLWDAGLGATFNWGGQELALNLQVQNLLDTYYLNHLSRYRLINVPEQGRNVVLSLKVPFAGRIPRR